MEYPLRNTAGAEVGQIQLDDRVFGVPFNSAVVHQVLVAQHANARKGTAKTKTRTEVSGGGAKPRPQKYTGRSRQGSIRAPQWKGGGIVHGPQPRSYKQATPRKMKRLAIRCLLSQKAADRELIVVDNLGLTQPSTKQITAILGRLGAEQALIALPRMDRTVHLSARNLQQVRVNPTDLLNVVDLLRYDYLVMTEEAVRRAEALWGHELTRRKVPAREAAHAGV